MRENEIDDSIKRCIKCKSNDFLKKILLFEKPNSFWGSEKPNIIILGHSPTVRTSQKATTVLKMDKKNQPLYKYINDKILIPLGAKEDNIYCTNLLKCQTKNTPEEIYDKDTFFESVLENCIELFEKEVLAIKPKLIISLSQRVLSYISQRYLNQHLTMKESFGKLFTININGERFQYIPVVHIPKGDKSKVALHYFPEQSKRLEIASPIINHQSYLDKKYNELVLSKEYYFNDKNFRSNIVENAGIYIIYLSINHEPLYVGRTKKLKQRIYTNHLMGPLINARLKKYLIEGKEVKNIDEAKKYIKDNCYVKYILVDNYRQRGMLEGYFTGVLKPKYGIDEEH